jgi:hypothetical protein
MFLRLRKTKTMLRKEVSVLRKTNACYGKMLISFRRSKIALIKAITSIR